MALAWVSPSLPLNARPHRRRRAAVTLHADSPTSANIGFLGCGKMGRAVLSRMIAASFLSPVDAYASARTAKTLRPLAALGIPPEQLLLGDNARLLRACDTIVLGVKPQSVRAVLEDVALAFDPERHLLISLIAGVPADAIADALQCRVAHVVRAIPTTAAAVGASATALAAGSHASEADVTRCEDMFRACGTVELLADERQLNAAAAVALPAFSYIALEALADAAVLEGLPRDVARRLAAAALLSAATMAVESPDVHPAALRNDVESPGGVTIRASRELERGGYRAAIMNAVAAATARSIELGSS